MNRKKEEFPFNLNWWVTSAASHNLNKHHFAKRKSSCFDVVENEKRRKSVWGICVYLYILFSSPKGFFRETTLGSRLVRKSTNLFRREVDFFIFLFYWIPVFCFQLVRTAKEKIFLIFFYLFETYWGFLSYVHWKKYQFYFFLVDNISIITLENFIIDKSI